MKTILSLLFNRVRVDVSMVTLLPRLTVHAPLGGFLKIWAFRNYEKVTHLTVHAPIPGYRCMHCYEGAILYGVNG